MVARALGGMDGMERSNSYEAFVSSYEKGFCVFEADLSLTPESDLADIGVEGVYSGFLNPDCWPS